MGDESAGSARTSAEVPFISVVVPVRDDESGLDRCLGHLGRQDYPATRFEVIVVDNGSVRPPEQVVASNPPARLVTEPRPGSYAARNAGLSVARGELIAFTDADCLPRSDWLRRAAAALLVAPGTGLLAGHVEVVPADPRRPRAVELYEMLHAFPQARYASEQRYGATANVVTRRRVVDEVGPFDPGLLSGGDKEWGRRVHAAGWAVEYRPDVVVRHPARPTWREYRRKLDRVFAGEFEAREAHGEPLGDLGTLTVRRVVPPVGTILRHWSDPRLPDTRARLLYAVGACVARWNGTAAGLRARRTAGTGR